MLPGVFKATKKDGTVYYRSSFTYQNKHISLGSFPTEWTAHTAYAEASNIMSSSCSIQDYSDVFTISFEKYVILVNFRDNEMYFKTPIYLKQISALNLLREGKNGVVLYLSDLKYNTCILYNHILNFAKRVINKIKRILHI